MAGDAFIDFFFLDAASTPEIYTLSLHDALPIFVRRHVGDEAALERTQLGQRDRPNAARADVSRHLDHRVVGEDRKSTRLNSSHTVISYAVFCLKKKTIDTEGHINDDPPEPIDAP